VNRELGSGGTIDSKRHLLNMQERAVGTSPTSLEPALATNSGKFVVPRE
jgi:hypothetical protein